MARTAQILVLFLFAICAVQCYSSNRHGYSSGRSHSGHYDPRNYHRHRSYGRRGSSHSRLRSSSGADPDTSVSSTPIALLKENSHSNDILRSVNGDGKSGDNHQDNGDTIKIDGSTPGSGENDLDAGTINVRGLSPNSNDIDKLPFGNDNGIMPGGVPNNPNDSGNSIIINGLHPGDNIDGNPSHDGNANKIDNLLPYNGGNNKPNNDNSIKIDGLTPNDNIHIPNINPGTIDINGKLLDKNGPGPDSGNIKVNGMLPNENNKPIHDNLPNESKSKPDHNSGEIVNRLPNENNVGGQPGNNQPDKHNGHLNHDKSTIGDKKGPNNDHNTINFDGLIPGRGNNVPDTGKLPNNKNEWPHNISVHGSSPDIDGHNPKHNDHTNGNNLLPGGDSNNSDHGIDNKDKGGLTNLGKLIHDDKNVDGFKPTGYKPDENHLNDNGLPAGGEGGMHKKLPNENRPYRPNRSNSGNFNRSGYPGYEDHNNNWNPSEKRPGYEPRKPNRRPGYNTHENNFRPHFHGNLDNKGANNKENNSFIYPVYLPDGQAIYPSGIISQNSKIPAFYIVMINGQPTLVKNPAAASEKDNSIDINSILGQLGVGGISMGSLNGLVPNWLQLGEGIKSAGIGMLPQPFVTNGFNLGNRVPPGSVLVNGFPTGSVSPLIPGEQQINVEPVIAEPVAVQQPIITEPISQPIYTIPVPPQNPGGIYGYPSIPYPAPWPAMWDGMNPNTIMNWPSIFDFFVKLGAHLPQNETPHKGGTIDKNKGSPEPTEKTLQPNNNKPTEKTLQPNNNKPTEKTLQPNNNKPTEKTLQPNSNKPTEKTLQPHNNKPTEKTLQPNYNKPTEETLQPNSNKPTEKTLQPHNNKPTEKTLQPNSNKPTEKTLQPHNNKPTEKTLRPNSNKPTEKTLQPHNNKPTEKTLQPNTAKPTNTDLTNFKDLANPGNDNTGLHIPVIPYEPTLVNLLNVVLKHPNRGSHPTTEPIQKPNPSENNFALLPKRQPSTVDKTINDLLAMLKSNAGDKAFKELIELLKSKSGDKDIKDLFSVRKPKTSAKTLHELLHILGSHPGGKNIYNLLALLNHYGDRNEPNPAIIRQILRHLLDSYNQPNMNVLVEPGMDEVTRLSLILLLNLLANNLGNEYSSGMGFGGLYEQMNPANLYFLGHYPCDYANIHEIAGGQSKGLWQLLSHMYGMSNLHNIRLDRSAEEDDDIKPSTPIPNTDDMKK